MRQDYTHIAIVVDRSGSMRSVASDASGGINQLIADQGKLDGKITLTLDQFDDKYEHVVGPTDIKAAPEYELVPRGSTALLDAVGRTINTTGQWLRDMPEVDRPAKVIFVIATDGYENASTEFKNEQIREMVKTQTDDYQWDFIYIGAGVDAFAEAANLGVRYHTTSATTPQAYAGTYSALSRTISGAHTYSASAGVGGQSIADSLATDVDEHGNATGTQGKGETKAAPETA